MLLQLGAEVAEPLVVWEFPKENVRMLAELKRYVEAQPQQRSPPPCPKSSVHLGTKSKTRKPVMS
jgi:hypothetical protein